MLQTFQALVIGILDVKIGFLQHLQGMLSHAASFGTRLSQRNGRSLENPHVDEFRAQINLRFGPTDQPGRYRRENSNQRQENEGIDDIEQSMRVCDVAGDIGLIPKLHPELLGLLLGLNDQIGIPWGDE